MSNNEIVELYYSFIVELAKKWNVDDDCLQMIFLDILLYDNAKLNRLHSKDEMRFGLTRVIKNYGFSTTSRYYTTYKKYYKQFDEGDVNEDQSE